MKSDPRLTFVQEKIFQVLRKCSGQYRVMISLLSSVQTEMTSIKNYHFPGGQTDRVSWPVLTVQCTMVLCVHLSYCPANMWQQWKEAKIRLARPDTNTDTGTKYHKVERCYINTSQNITTQHNTSHHKTSHHITTNYITLHYTTTHHILLNHNTPHQIITNQITTDKP